MANSDSKARLYLAQRKRDLFWQIRALDDQIANLNLEILQIEEAEAGLKNE